MKADAVNALNKGASVAALGLNSIGQAERGYLAAVENAENVMQARSNIWGGVANGSFESSGYWMGGGMRAMMDRGAVGQNEPLNNCPSHRAH